MKLKEYALNVGWRICLPVIRLCLRIKKKCEFERGAYISYLTKLEGHNHIGRNSCVPGTQMGFGSSVAFDCYFFHARIGKYSCIGPRTATICGRHPTKNIVSIHPAFFSPEARCGLSYTDRQIFREAVYADEKRKITVVVGNDVWIGADAKIMEGVTVGDGAVIAAGALVLKDVEPYAIVAGLPAKVIGYRFEKKEREWLLAYKWWNRPESWLRENAAYFSDIKKFMYATGKKSF